jgi:hypothetical protein
MRRSIAVTLALVLAVAAFSVPASGAKKVKKKTRKATAIYDSPAIGSGDATGVCSGSSGCAMFGIGPKETFISFEIEDQLGLPVYATVGQDQNPDDQFTDVIGKFCGTTEEPFPIQPGIQVIVWVWALPGANPPCPGAATTGTVTAKISNLP